MTKFSIVTLTEKDWESYRDLRLEGLAEEQKAFATSPAEASLWPSSRWTNELNLISDTLENPKKEGQKYITIFAKADNKLVGMTSASWGQKNKQEHQAIILWVYVNKNYRGQGIAKKLMQTILDFLESKTNVKKAYLTVIESQIPARKMYESFGFKECGRLTKSLNVNGKYFDELFMEKFLTDF